MKKVMLEQTMKHKFILCLALVLSGGLTSISSSAQDAAALFPIIKNRKAGFIDQTGALIISSSSDWLPNLQLEGKHFSRRTRTRANAMDARNDQWLKVGLSG